MHGNQVHSIDKNTLNEKVRLRETIILHDKAILIFPVEIEASDKAATFLFQLLAALLCHSPEVQFYLLQNKTIQIGEYQ